MKKWLIIYTSNTNNTKQIAEAMFSALGNESRLICSKDFHHDDVDGYDVVAIGFWVTRGGPDPLTQALLPRIQNKLVVLFQTLGAEPTGEHAVTSLAKAAYMLGDGCQIIGTFSSRGKINPALLAKRRALPLNSPHACTEENVLRWSAAAAHPNEEDKENARLFVEKIKRKFNVKDEFERKKENIDAIPQIKTINSYEGKGGMFGGNEKNHQNR